ncbi:hypothetical protein [Azospirillum argentinense]
MRVEHPETARIALLTMADADLSALSAALAEVVDLQPGLAPVILQPVARLEEHARLFQPAPTPPRLAVVNGRSLDE